LANWLCDQPDLSALGKIFTAYHFSAIIQGKNNLTYHITTLFNTFCANRLESGRPDPTQWHSRHVCSIKIRGIKYTLTMYWKHRHSSKRRIYTVGQDTCGMRNRQPPAKVCLI